MPEFSKSNIEGKKYSVITPSGKKIHFGSSNYKHFKDVTGVGAWSHLDHNDEKRRSLYKKRHSAIETKDGNPAYKDKEQPAYYSWNYLW
jgi:hypothetical protein